MTISAWVLLHTFYALLESERSKAIQQEFRSLFAYVLMCVAVFSFIKPLQLAIVESCVIGCFYVFCVMFHRILMRFLPKEKHWALFMGVNNTFIAIVISFLLYCVYYG
jgi:hypothetical protein